MLSVSQGFQLLLHFFWRLIAVTFPKLENRTRGVLEMKCSVRHSLSLMLYILSRQQMKVLFSQELWCAWLLFLLLSSLDDFIIIFITYPRATKDMALREVIQYSKIIHLYSTSWDVERSYFSTLNTWRLLQKKLSYTLRF